MIGRKEEIEKLDRIYNSKRSELVAIYGRRRVGKTYLIEETFKDKFIFKHSGIYYKNLEVRNVLAFELRQFFKSLKEYGLKSDKMPNDWFEAFSLLKELIIQNNRKKRILVFIDEFPWLDTPKSNFISAFEFFWNSFGCSNSKLMMIICGSSSSWILNNMIHNHGGIYNRVTSQLKIKPFNLKETEELLISNGFNYSRYDIVQTYMVFGGIPYYLNQLNKDKSFMLNIDELFFGNNALFINEFDDLFSSTFESPTIIKNIIYVLSKKNIGFTREEIANELNISNGGNLSLLLKSLIESGFIIKYVPFNKNKITYYKLIDPFAIFYLNFKNYLNNCHFFKDNYSSSLLSSWRGLSYEIVCFNHIEEIKKFLGINGISVEASPYFEKNDEGVYQIDMILKRKDNIINICEIKFYHSPYRIDKNTYLKLLSKNDLIEKNLNKKESIQNILITSLSAIKNEYSFFFNEILTLDDLF